MQTHSSYSSSGSRPARRPFRHSSAKPAGRPFRGGGNFRSGSNFSRPSQSRGRNFQGTSIHFSKFINKAPIIEEVKAFVPEHAFSDFAISEKLKGAIGAKGYTAPTPIQDQAIPQVLQGKDVVGIANTGTGKTGAFLIPLIEKVLNNPRERVLVMVPTRELAVQIETELSGFARAFGIRGTVCVGGIGIYPQIKDLARQPAFVIGTPGRLKDLIERKSLNLKSFGTVVLDEADRMLDMGFIHDMRTILSLLATPRQTLFFSATLSPEIEKLIGEFLHAPVRISVRTAETSQSVEQDIIRVPQGGSKFDLLMDLLIQPEFKKVLIFGRTKHGTEKLSNKLEERGIKAQSIHGNKTQQKRQKALELFRSGSAQVLCATDVAARGLDINDVTHVINYDQPATYEDYVHRIGRTGRAGKRGIALTFID